MKRSRTCQDISRGPGHVGSSKILKKAIKIMHVRPGLLYSEISGWGWGEIKHRDLQLLKCALDGRNTGVLMLSCVSSAPSWHPASSMESLMIRNSIFAVCACAEPCSFNIPALLLAIPLPWPPFSFLRADKQKLCRRSKIRQSP